MGKAGQKKSKFGRHCTFFCHVKLLTEVLFSRDLLYCTGGFLFSGLKAALQAAKENIGRHYAVVGFLDDMEGFLSLLEATLPAFFSGAKQA